MSDPIPLELQICIGRIFDNIPLEIVLVRIFDNVMLGASNEWMICGKCLEVCNLIHRLVMRLT
jgi:hypothetical protein